MLARAFLSSSDGLYVANFVSTVITVRAFGIATFAGLTAVKDLFYLNFATNITADMAVAFVLSRYLWVNKTGSRR